MCGGNFGISTCYSILGETRVMTEYNQVPVSYDLYIRDFVPGISILNSKMLGQEGPDLDCLHS